MATITLYKDKLNGVGSLISTMVSSVNNLDMQLGVLKSTLQGGKTAVPIILTVLLKIYDLLHRLKKRRQMILINSVKKWTTLLQ